MVYISLTMGYLHRSGITLRAPAEYFESSPCAAKKITMGSVFVMRGCMPAPKVSSRTLHCDEMINHGFNVAAERCILSAFGQGSEN